MSTSKSLFVIPLILLISCQGRFPTDKRYWDTNDYYQVIREIEYKTPKGEEYPRFSNPETAVVIHKLLDPENYKVILEDPELGVKYKSEISTEFFDRYKNLVEVYSTMDQQDNYVYADELAEIFKFGLGLQILYFKLGNDHIREESDSQENRRIMRQNEQTLVNNYTLFLNNIKESRFGPSGSARLADAIETHFPTLIKQFPGAGYGTMRADAVALQEKVKTRELKTALSNLIAILDAKLAPPTEATPIK
jgi:hypothetical protein